SSRIRRRVPVSYCPVALPRHRPPVLPAILSGRELRLAPARGLGRRLPGPAPPHHKRSRPAGVPTWGPHRYALCRPLPPLLRPARCDFLSRGWRHTDRSGGCCHRLSSRHIFPAPAIQVSFSAYPGCVSSCPPVAPQSAAPASQLRKDAPENSVRFARPLGLRGHFP